MLIMINQFVWGGGEGESIVSLNHFTSTNEYIKIYYTESYDVCFKKERQKPCTGFRIFHISLNSFINGGFVI